MTLKGKTIVILGNIRNYNAIKATSIFLAHTFAKYNKVYFIEHPLTVKDYFKNKGSGETSSRGKKISPFSDGLIETDNPNLKIIISPPVQSINFLPEGPFYRFVLKINQRILSQRIKRTLRSERIKEFIYINSFNFHYPSIAEMIKPKLAVYQCVDPMIIPYDMKHGIRSEGELVKKSDIVICTSKALYDEKKEQNTNTYFVPNAADFDHCTQALIPGLPVYDKIKNLPKPIIGYLGTIERRIDYTLLKEVITANPDKTFVLAGPVWDNYLPDSFLDLKNLHIIGSVAYEDTPRLVKGFDVAIIPFKKDDVSDTIFPLKLFEYLSAGKPVVVTNFNNTLKDYTEDTVDYCDGAEDFSKCVNEALLTNGPEKIEKRLAIARNNTWEKRAEEISGIINKYL